MAKQKSKHHPDRLLAVGVDGARGGWLCALGFGDGKQVERAELRLLATFAEVAALYDAADDRSVRVAVDVPMGLLDQVDFRPCDQQARDILKGRRSAVFAPPSRPLLTMASYAQARAYLDEQRLGNPALKSLSAQAFGIQPKVAEVDNYLQAHSDATEWLWECHPELSYYALDGEMKHDKRSVAGMAQRLRALRDELPGVLRALSELDATSRQADPTDALDALLALTTAMTVRADEQEVLGGERDSTGLPMRMAL